MKKVRIALIGAGQRGKDSYGAYTLEHGERAEFVAVAEPNKTKREEFAKKHNIDEEYQFESWEELLNKDKFCDAVVIATPDDMHFEPTKLAIEKDYHILLEKPISNDPAEVIELGRLAKKTDKVILVCHVLRYTPFYSTIKEIIDSGVIGKVQNIHHSENIGYFHFAHSFVRGNWRNSEESSPLILQKSCHDMDILLWLIGSKSTKIASFGNLSYFTSENRQEGASDRSAATLDEDDGDGPYSAAKLYYPNIGRWPTTVITEDQTEEGVRKALEKGPYGRSVFGGCDNNVMDHQSTIIEFEDQTTVTFNLSAFSNKVHRTTRVMGSLGEIIADDAKNEVEYQVFGSDERTIINPTVVAGGHGGGDTGIMEEFISLILEGGEGLSSISNSIESHIMAFAAEHSRVSGEVVNMEEYYKKF